MLTDNLKHILEDFNKLTFQIRLMMVIRNFTCTLSFFKYMMNVFYFVVNSVPLVDSNKLLVFFLRLVVLGWGYLNVNGFLSGVRNCHQQNITKYSFIFFRGHFVIDLSFYGFKQFLILSCL